MRFSSWPDDEVALQGGDLVLFRGPEGSGVGDLETLVGGGYVRARVELEPGDLALLAAGAPIYVSQLGGCVPISVDIPADREPADLPDLLDNVALSHQGSRLNADGICAPGHHVTPHRGCILR